MDTGTSSGRIAQFGSNAEDWNSGTYCYCNLTIMGIFLANRKACHSPQICLSKDVNSFNIFIAWNTRILILPTCKLPSFVEVSNFLPMLSSSLWSLRGLLWFFSGEDIHCKLNSTNMTRLQKSRFVFLKSVQRSVRASLFQTHSRGLFLEGPGNLSGPKSNI